MIHFQNCPKSFQNCPKSLKNAGDFFVAIWNMERNHWQAAYQSQWLHMINYACCLLKRGTWTWLLVITGFSETLRFLSIVTLFVSGQLFLKVVLIKKCQNRLILASLTTAILITST